jgi:hypothetical protein
MKNFLGKDGFVWFMGEVETRVDPLALGRCQVRIFGWHSENKEELPTIDLPWALPLYPVNNSKSFSAPKTGDWVVGFFMDGEAGQAPVMMGVLPAVKTKDEVDDDSKTYDSNSDVNPEPVYTDAMGNQHGGGLY